MFTGIVECACSVVSVQDRQGGRRLGLDLAPLRDAPGGNWTLGPAEGAGAPGSAAAAPGGAGAPGGGAGVPVEDGPLVGLGDSVAVCGVCLTVAELQGDVAGFDVIAETLRCTALGELAPGARVNVERALRYGDRVDGHLVQGHVELTGRVLARDVQPGQTWLSVECGAEFVGRLLPKGSVTIDGVSLTVAERGADRFAVALVPHTLERTTLGDLQPGERVNLEPDMLGQWVIHAVGQLAPPR